MAHMIINGRQIELDGEKNVLGVIRKAGIDLPTFCYYPELAPYGACRMCLVENERGGMIAACSEVPFDGMVVKTNTEKLKKHRKLMLELLLGSHCHDCLTCPKSEKCQLQELAVRVGVDKIRFQNTREPQPVDDSSHVLEIDRVKCVLCGNCIRICEELQNVGAVNFAKRGSEMYVSTAFDKPLNETYCTGCGQCSVYCPTGAITVKDESDKLWQAIYDDGLKTVALFDPSIASTIGAEFGLSAGEDALGKLVSALRRIGFDEVYDLSKAADAAGTAEVSAFLDRFDEKGKLPWFTSWCPAWRKYVHDRHPDLKDYLSPNDVPAQAISAAVNAREIDAAGSLFVTAIGPCTALKHESTADLALTALELVQIIKGMGLAYDRIAPEEPMALSGAEGGAGGDIDATRLSEAVTRAAGDRGVRAVTVYGLANAEEIVRQVKAGDVRYDFIDVLACPHGCETGAGHPRASVKQRIQTEI